MRNLKLGTSCSLMSSGFRLVDEQSDCSDRLNQIVRGTHQFRAAEAEAKLIRLPTGDGMVFVFFTSPEAPVRCAAEIAKAMKENSSGFALRMGIHSGPVNKILDGKRQIESGRRRNQHRSARHGLWRCRAHPSFQTSG